MEKGDGYNDCRRIRLTLEKQRHSGVAERRQSPVAERVERARLDSGKPGLSPFASLGAELSHGRKA